jgi:MFS transporter, DHA1 family, tetracycline resistance protein
MLTTPKSALPKYVLLLTVVIDAMGIGLIFPVMPDLIRDVLHTDLSHAALWGGALITVFALMQFIFGPIIGNLSDAYGRRPVLLVSLAVMVGDYLVMALAGSIWLLMLGRLVGGITSATHATATAFMADISAAETKAANFGLLGAGFGLGFVLGPIMGGFLAEFGTRAPFLAAGALAACNLLLALVILPETVPSERRRPFSWRRANPLGALQAIARLPGLRSLLTVIFLYDISMQVYGVIWAYFGQARFGWDSRLIGISLTLYGVAMILVQALLFRPTMARLGERRTVLFGLGANVVFLSILSAIRSGTATLIITPLSALGELAQPALIAIASRAAPDDAQGEMQGVLSSLMALAMIVTPLIMTTIFGFFTAPEALIFLPGAPFAAAALLLIPAIAIFALFARRQDG